MKKSNTQPMLQIGDTIVSVDLIQKNFICNIQQCKGSCCVHGDSGAPLEEEEVTFLEENYEKIKPFMNEEGIKAVEEKGIWLIDSDHDMVTPLVGDKECAYTIFEDGIALCGIEKAHEAGIIEWQKPISCHLYPVRTKKYTDFTAVNYDTWEICEPARLFGKQMKEPLYKFLKTPLTRKFGEAWYTELCLVADAFNED